MKQIFLGILLLGFILPLQSQSWSSWKTSSCFKGLDYRTKKTDYYESSGKHRWRVQFKSRYKEKIHFSYDIYSSSSDQSNGSFGRTSINPGGTDSDSRNLKNGDSIYVSVSRVRFGKDYGSDYAECDH